MGFHRFFLLFTLVGSLFFACHPERSFEENPEASLSFNLDTLYFDTVFTTIGTATEAFRVFNPHKQFLKIDEISLAGGASSVFRINVDGSPGLHFTDVEIAPGDSMYVFVEATLDPNGSDEILRIQDSVVFQTNGNLQDIDLVAWGQDVHIIQDSVFDEHTTWIADKPYLILNYAFVDSMSSLTLDPGVKVHLHRDALLYVDGSLHMNGTMEEPVWVGGDRLEKFYEDVPGQWRFIYLSGLSHDNRITYTEIRNGTMGLLISAPPESGKMPDLEISNSMINHMSSNGIYALNAKITGSNLVIGNCGGSCTALNFGGDYQFTHCTFANYWPSGYSNRQLPALLLTDYFANYDEEGNLEIFTGGEFERAEILNSIIYGSNRMELIIDSYEDLQLNYRFDHCLTKIDESDYDYTSDPLFTNIINNEDPLFVAVPDTFELDSLSPAIDAGLPAYAIDFPFDLNGNSRLDDEAPDLGSYEWIPKVTDNSR